MVSVKKRIDIESLLRWAFRQELPKAHKLASFSPAGFGGAWGGIERFGELLEVIDAPENEFGVVPDLTATGWPHEDALRIHNAVCGLDHLPLLLPDDWNPLGDMPGFAGSAQAVARAIETGTYVTREGERRLKTTPSRLIRKHAIMGGCPVWEGEEPQAQVVCSSRSKQPLWFRRVLVMIEEGDPQAGIKPVYHEVEVDGLDPKRRIPYPDAYQKMVYEPDPVEIVLGRAEYEVWHAALGLLVEELNAYEWTEEVDGEEVRRFGLADFVVLPSARPERPWETGDIPAQRVLPDLTQEPCTLTLVSGSWNIHRGA